MRARRIFGPVKQLLFGRGRKPRAVWSGAFRGLKMSLDPASQSQYILGIAEREAQRWLPALSSGVKSAIDIGAASGEYTLYFLARTAAEQVLAFDPDPVSREQFVQNMALNGFANHEKLRASTQYIKSEAGPDAVTLDDLLPSLKLPCVIKIDVDGAELDILHGAREMVRTRQVRWLIETHSAKLEQDCAALLTETNYDVTIIPNAWWRFIVPEARPIPHNRWLVGVPSGMSSGVR
jgi:hypothetical protein